MKTTLTKDQITTYREQGFLAIHDVLDPTELEALGHAVDEALVVMGEQRVSGSKDDDVKIDDDYYSKVFTQKLNLWKINETVKSYFLSTDLGRMLCELEGVDGMRVWHDQALIKQPFANATAWHLDNPYWSTYTHHAISIWIALEDATWQNGCMYYLPGTHRTATFDNVTIGKNMNALFDVYGDWKKINSVGVPLKAGSCALHNGLTAHGAGANMTNGTRRAMTCAYIPDGSTFNGQRNILPRAYFESLGEGDLLNNDELNPLVYKAG